ncbi:hypothetical protein BHE74_00019734 [Ensete ventricosum]|nr:hypothetical protein BHE74_00019734 [Ensete ventricosum]
MDPDSAWYTPLRTCLTIPSQTYKLGLTSAPKWPDRLHAPPERTSVVPGGNSGGFKHDDSKWKVRIKHYKTLLPALGSDKIRNVMDMNTLYGGFAAALISSPLWVMNVVSSYGPNSLGVVYDRGLIGMYHDCQNFLIFCFRIHLLGVNHSQLILEHMTSYILMAYLLQKATGETTYLFFCHFDFS